MAAYNRLTVLNTMIATGLVPVFYEPDIELAKQIVTACVKGGARCIEMTNRGDGAVDVFRRLIEHCRKELPEAILGVGSIVDAPSAAAFINAGANFVVGPLLDEETARVCNQRKIPYSPGCGTLTEIHRAHALGVEIIKIFPAGEVGGPSFVKAVKGPCPWTTIMPTGGVDATEASLSEWFGAGVVCVGMGSKLITKELIAQKDFDALTAKVKDTLAIIKKCR